MMTDPAQLPIGRDDPLLKPIEGITVIDVDTHLTEPGDLWTSRAPARYKELVPRVVYREDQYVGKVLGWKPPDGPTPVWVAGEDTVLGYAGGASVINHDNVKVKGSDFIRWPLTEVSPAASFVQPRLEIMDEVGVWAQIVYPNAVGFGGQRFAQIDDPQLRLLCLTIWNDAMAEMQEESGGRLNGMGIVPWWDRDVAIAEIERIHGLGLHGVNTNADPQNQGMPDLSDPYFQPMWEACADLGLPVNFHIGASVSQASYSGTSPWPSLNNDMKLALGSSMLYIGNARIIANLIYSGVLDRNPELKVVSVESGIGWVPFILDALDYQAVENNVDTLSMKPSEYFKRQMYACFWFESGRALLEDIERIGVDNCMFETDFPHPTCLYPQPFNAVAATFDEHNVEWPVREKLLGGNAARVYNISLSS
jgi:predicted TIM-barrel fold metal-dependent hydrolase